MPTTVHLALLQALQAALASLPGVPAEHVHIDLVTPVDAADCPAVVLTIAELRFDPLGSDGVHDLLKAGADVAVRIHSRGSPHTTVADPLIAAVHAAVMADPSLGGLALRCTLSASRPNQAPADGGAGTWELVYQVTAAVDERTLVIDTG